MDPTRPNTHDTRYPLTKWQRVNKQSKCDSWARVEFALLWQYENNILPSYPSWNLSKGISPI